MSERLPSCPFLPAPREQMDWRTLSKHGDLRGPEFYVSVLEYGHYLWQRRCAARAILCLDRAFGADLRGDEAVLQTSPLPYAAMRWILSNTPAGVFSGNPRVHFQHYAGRMNEPRREQRRWRAWACWALARAISPALPGDPKHVVVEPTAADITAQLEQHGHPGEAERWQRELRKVTL